MAQKLTILLIEPDQDFAGHVRAQLSRSTIKFELETASTLAVALPKMSRDDFRVLLVNLDLPDSKGLDTLRRIRNAASRSAIIAISSVDTDRHVLDILRNGAQEYMTKDTAQLSRLPRLIQTAVERSEALDRVKMHEYDQREDFVAMLAHDLKTPVSGANRIYDLLLEGWLGPLSAGQKEIVAKLRESNMSLLRMIQNMLEVYQFELSKSKIELQPIDLLPLLVDCVDHFSDTAKRNQVHISVHLPDSIGKMNGDAAAIRRLFLNGFDNAIKFSPTGGTVTISVEKGERDVTISISDQGPGIPSEHQSRLFERLWVGGGTKYTAGTGLGLYLCKRIAEAHAGTIICKSTEGQGATFVIRLPLVDAGKGSAHINHRHQK